MVRFYPDSFSKGALLRHLADILSLSLVMASQSLPLVAQHRLEALPLPALARLLTSTICSTFKYGTFLSSVSASVSLSPEKQVHISVGEFFLVIINF